MRLEHYIAELLYRYHCVVVPDFGGFLSNTTPARISTQVQTIYPPSKSLSFNQQLTKNDGLLVSYIANSKKQPYETLLQEVTNTTKKWRSKLDAGDRLYLEGIGTLWLGPNNRILFSPETGNNYLLSSFGLSSFTAGIVTREKLKEEVAALEEKTPISITPEKRAQSSWRPLMKYAALFLVLMAVGMGSYQYYQQSLQKKELVASEVNERVAQYIQEATIFGDMPLELPPLALNISKSTEKKGSHHIVAGAFRVKKNADKKIQQLRAQGYQGVYLGVNARGLHQVAYASFENNTEALQFLREIKRTVSPDAWLISER
ncbi:MAG: SPOR domain-containing protein [Bacteroidota bacterium]